MVSSLWRSMRFALKALPLGMLGCAAALLVACGDRSGLLSGSQAGSLQDALAAVQSACSGGEPARAEIAAQSFADRVNALPAGSVDRRLIANLQQGGATLQSLVARTCTGTTPTATTTTPTTTTATTTTATTTTTAPTPTTPTTTTPTTTTPTTPVPGGGGDGGGPGGDEGNGGGAGGNPGGAAPGQLKKQAKAEAKAEREAARPKKEAGAR
jgi:hypothetical protein